jgi:hypothetical protein
MLEAVLDNPTVELARWPWNITFPVAAMGSFGSR